MYLGMTMKHMMGQVMEKELLSTARRLNCGLKYFRQRALNNDKTPIELVS